MPTSEARIQANRQNAARSTGPKTEEGKARSRANAYKHGMTGDGVVIAEADAAEVERLSQAFRGELKAEGEIGHALTRRMAIMAVRMDRSVDHETAALGARVAQAVEDFEAPEGIGEAEADRLRGEAARRALFDPSKEACLARKYEAAAERCFFRSLRELRQIQKDSATSPAAEILAETQASMNRLGSFLPKKSDAPAKPSPTVAKPVSTSPTPNSASGTHSLRAISTCRSRSARLIDPSMTVATSRQIKHNRGTRKSRDGELRPGLRGPAPNRLLTRRLRRGPRKVLASRAKSGLLGFGP